MGGASVQSERSRFIEKMLERLRQEPLDVFAAKVLPDVLARGEKTFLCGSMVTALDVIAARATAPVFRVWAATGEYPIRVESLTELWRWFDLMQGLLCRYGIAENVARVQPPPREVLLSASSPSAKTSQVDRTKERGIGNQTSDHRSGDPDVTQPVARALNQMHIDAASTGRGHSMEIDAKKSALSKSTKDVPACDRSDLARVDVRVGCILTAKPHPDADALYVEEIDIGREDGPVTVCSGLRNHIPDAAALLGPCVVVANLKPVKMRGIVSQAMVLCATAADGSRVELIKPPSGAKPGDRIYFPGTDADRDNQPDPQLNPKKKIFEKVAEHLHTSDDASCEARYDEIPFMTDHGACRAATIQGGTIR
ncbi:hypothetical protein F1559_001291 [Cyanidiococcus yangmingshanensis]|uniref:tRNA-binding domain-containing protein n=1 Tax=Cyanidiococcus yangmingshanensis TaxID=2690220 RepID=A0A7J7IDR6_9RHOD|nr:hypothetical protein F1559_001291 [Cyanidiococcus yangmingshanensis]